jgi:hypothetical protein
MAETEKRSKQLFWERRKEWFEHKLPFFWHNWISATGSVLVVTSSFLLLLLFGLYVYNLLLARKSNPYVDLVAFLVLPGFLALGILLLFIGNAVHRSRERKHGPQPSSVQVGGMALVRKAAVVSVVAFVFLLGISLFSYEAYHFTDSVEFCAHVCHTVMEPESTTYFESPHANVPCVSCHIGAGASWYVRAKISGIRQVFAVLTDSYHRPIPSPVENLRPARETCEVCHWPSKFHGSKLVVRKHYEPDRDNTETVTANVLHVGGPDSPGGGAVGIHWHVDRANQVRYRHVDGERQDIVEVVQRTAAGEIRYLRDGADPDTTVGTWRVMDCLDCHNRPTHRFDLPEAAVDLAFANGRLDVAVPFLRRESVRVLREVVPAEDSAALVAQRLTAIYQADHPAELPALTEVLGETADELARILDRNVFPAMDIDWGTYTTNLSHFDPDGDLGNGGCFRCHDDEHVSEAGEVIEQDCETCHALLAWQEESWAGLSGVGADAFLRR